MLYLIIFVPIVAAFVILLGAPARQTALIGSLLLLALTISAFAMFDRDSGAFQFASSIPILPDWRLNFSVGLDGLSLVIVLLAAIVTLAAVWFTEELVNHEAGFYACLLFISAGAIGAFASAIRN